MLKSESATTPHHSSYARSLKKASYGIHKKYPDPSQSEDFARKAKRKQLDLSRPQNCQERSRRRPVDVFVIVNRVVCLKSRLLIKEFELFLNTSAVMCCAPISSIGLTQFLLCPIRWSRKVLWNSYFSFLR